MASYIIRDKHSGISRESESVGYAPSPFIGRNTRVYSKLPRILRSKKPRGLKKFYNFYFWLESGAYRSFSIFYEILEKKIMDLRKLEFENKVGE